MDDLSNLVKAADGDTELAQYGIVYVDEIDKIAAEASKVDGMYQEGVQINLLKLMEETDVNLQSSGYDGTNESIYGHAERWKTKETNHLHKKYTIVSGAFDQLGENVQKA